MQNCFFSLAKQNTAKAYVYMFHEVTPDVLADLIQFRETVGKDYCLARYQSPHGVMDYNDYTELSDTSMDMDRHASHCVVKDTDGQIMAYARVSVCHDTAGMMCEKLLFNPTNTTYESERMLVDTICDHVHEHAEGDMNLLVACEDVKRFEHKDFFSVGDKCCLSGAREYVSLMKPQEETYTQGR